MKISFYGGAQEVTGSCILFDSGGQKILIDCGFFQSTKFCDPRSGSDFPFNPKDIFAVFVTHAHIDHTGRIPKLVRAGFKGKIYSTAPTKDLAALMLTDSLGLLQKDAMKHGTPLIYEEGDVVSAMKLWQEIPYNKEIVLGDLKITLRDSGHVLGSAMVEIICQGKKIVFTGDIGNPPTPLLNDPEKIKGAEILIIESTYGDRVHQGREERQIMLERAIEETVKRRGVLMIPAFSLERTQELLAEVEDLLDGGRIPEIPIFLDSPLAIKTTAVYKKYESFFNKEAHQKIRSGEDIFRFKGLRMTLTTEESKSINEVNPPKIIIAGSGMSTGGRILHHEKRYLSDPNSTLLLVGYQAAGSLGRMLHDGAKEVRIHDEIVPVNARIAILEGYSSHPDRDKLVDMVASSKDTLQKVFAVHGEPGSSLFLVQRVRDYLGIEAYAPRYGETYDV